MELIHSYKLAAVIDFGAADGVLAMTCARDARIPYLGFCLTPTRKAMLHTKLIQDAMRDSCKERDSRYDAKLAKLMAPAEAAAAAASAMEAKKKKEEAAGAKGGGAGDRAGGAGGGAAGGEAEKSQEMTLA